MMPRGLDTSKAMKGGEKSGLELQWGKKLLYILLLTTIYTNEQEYREKKDPLRGCR